LGVYPETSLKQARDKRDTARQQLADGIDPGENKKAIKQAKATNAANSFEVIAREWFECKMSEKSDSHKKRTLANLERDVFPFMGGQAISDLKAQELLKVLRKVEERGAVETAHRVLQVCGQVFRYAIATKRAENDISQALKGALKPVKGGHFGAITDPFQLGALLRAIDDYNGSVVVKTALQIAPLVFVRPGELRAMQWQQLDFEAREWLYLVTKTQVQHIVPLSEKEYMEASEAERCTTTPA